jgi:adenine-specific DNA-methyltransferase
MSVQDGHATRGQFYRITSPTGVVHEPPQGRCWTYTAEKFKALDKDGRIYWPKGGDGKPRLKVFAAEAAGLAPLTLWMAAEVGSNADAKRHLRSVALDHRTFDTPKPVGMLERIVEIATNPGDRILDYFLGSGTTAVAAGRLGRRWLGIEQSAATARNFALPWLESEGLSVTVAEVPVSD